MPACVKYLVLMISREGRRQGQGHMWHGSDGAGLCLSQPDPDA